MDNPNYGAIAQGLIKAALLGHDQRIRASQKELARLTSALSLHNEDELVSRREIDTLAEFVKKHTALMAKSDEVIVVDYLNEHSTTLLEEILRAEDKLRADQRAIDALKRKRDTMLDACQWIDPKSLRVSRPAVFNPFG